MTPLISNILIAVLSLILIMFSASYIIAAVSDYAKKLGISNYLIGFLVVTNLHAAFFGGLFSFFFG